LSKQNDYRSSIILHHFVLIVIIFLASMTTAAGPGATHNGAAAVTHQSSFRNEIVDAVVIGSGLAGLTATLQILDRGGRVVLVEKESKLGGNSIKASSGINACVPMTRTEQEVHVSEDEIESFFQDTFKSAGDRANPELIRVLVENSAESLQWLVDRLGWDVMESRTRLGGHSRDRTYRPAKGTIGFSLISAMQKVLEGYEQNGTLRVMLSARAMKLIEESGEAWAVKVLHQVKEQGDSHQENEQLLSTKNVVIATGGFAAARGNDSYLAKYSPGYLEMPATFGDFSTGDGIDLACAVGATIIDMDKVQIHPTGFVDPADPSNPSKILCAEVMRGIGGILLSRGTRFCNELGNRDYVTKKMMEQKNMTRDTKFYLLLSSAAAKKAEEHVSFYSWKGLLKKFPDIGKVEEFMTVESGTLQRTLKEYQSQCMDGQDEFGKVTFPDSFSSNCCTEGFYVGCVTPVLHYCMGGLMITETGKVLNEKKQIIPGLYAAGEVAGGVHGSNRLAGNSLLECLVYGRIIGQQVIV
jgi:flavocytochrome c